MESVGGFEGACLHPKDLRLRTHWVAVVEDEADVHLKSAVANVVLREVLGQVVATNVVLREVLGQVAVAECASGTIAKLARRDVRPFSNSRQASLRPLPTCYG